MKLRLTCSRPTDVNAVKFVVISGLGWCLDMLMFSALVGWLDIPPGASSFISATVVSLIVFSSTRKFVFRASGKSGAASFIFLIYTEFNIVACSALVELISVLATKENQLNITAAGIIAKLAVTPISLLTNYFVSKWLSIKVHG